MLFALQIIAEIYANSVEGKYWEETSLEDAIGKINHAYLDDRVMNYVLHAALTSWDVGAELDHMSASLAFTGHNYSTDDGMIKFFRNGFSGIINK